jgi:high-affinity K+ transport system ATPase subunit B
VVGSVLKLTGAAPPEFSDAVLRIARAGSTPLALAVDNQLLGAI